MTGALICPNCGKKSTETTTQFGQRDDCYPCDLWSWGGKPLVDAETHDARKAAHEAFDALWKGPDAIMSRGKAYRSLRTRLGIPADDCHMAKMTAEMARRVPGAAENIRRAVFKAAATT